MNDRGFFFFFLRLGRRSKKKVLRQSVNFSQTMGLKIKIETLFNYFYQLKLNYNDSIICTSMASACFHNSSVYYFARQLLPRKIEKQAFSGDENDFVDHVSWRKF